MENGVDRAVEECIQEGVMAEFLLAHKAEVIEMCLTEYNKEETMAMLRKEAREDGLEEGRKIGKEIGIKEGRKEELLDLIRDGILSKDQVADRLHMSVEQLEQEMKKKELQ